MANSRLPVLFFCCAIAVLLVSNAIAVQPYEPNPAPSALGELWRWHHIVELDRAGFRCMANTPDGVMWFGVNNGLLRYDGTHWERHNAANGFVDDAATDVAVSSDGSIYAVSRHRLYRYRDQQWKQVFPVQSPSRITLTCLTPSVDGGVWVGSSRGFFYVKDGAVTLWTESRRAEEVINVLPQGTLVEVLPDFQSSNWGLIVGMYESADGILTIGYTTGWFVRIDTRRPLNDPNTCLSTRIADRVSFNQNISMFEMDDGRIWASFGPKVYILDIPGGQSKVWPLSESRDGDQGNHGLIRSAAGERFIASPSHVFREAGQNWESFSYPSQDTSSFNQLMLDAKQNLWVGKLHGKVFRVDLSNERWKTFEGLIFQGEDPSGARWFLDVQGHVVCQRGAEWIQYDQQDGLPDTPVALLCGRTGPVWVMGSHANEAASAFLDEQGTWNRTIHEELPVKLSPSSLFEDKDGGIWFGTMNRSPDDKGGLIRAIPDGAGSYRFEHRKTPVRAWHITQLPDETIVIGSYGLWALNGSSLEKIPQTYDGNSKCMDLDGTPDGAIWVAHDGFGVRRLKEDESTHYTEQDGLADDMVAALLCRDAATVWALSATGVSYFDGRGWIPNIYGSLFPGILQNGGSIHQSKDGSLWINFVTPAWYRRAELRYEVGSNITFKSIRCRPASRPPETKILDAMERVALPGNTTIRWKGTSPWQETEDKNLYYSWRLDDEAWSAYALNRDVTLRSIKPGKHSFEVRARDYDLNVDPTPAVISFVAVAPIWQQAWFILLVVLFVGLVMLAIWQWFRIHEVKAVAAEKYATDLERIKLRFFTNISHELRTPLTVLLGTLKSVMAEPKLTFKEQIAMALRNARKLQTLTNEMLDLRKLEQGAWKLEPKYGDIVSFIREITGSLEPMAGEKNITIKMNGTGPKSVWFDPGKLNKIVTNLISNAIKYGLQDGNVTVHVNVEEHCSDPMSPVNGVVIEVEDDGIGIKAEEIPHIFERFYQGTDYTVKKSSSGIGLSFTKELVDLWGGHIEAESPVREGRGTCFTVTLPLNIQPQSESKTETWLKSENTISENTGSDEVEEPTAGCEKEKILIIDDDADLRRFIRNELEKHYEIFEAVDGEDGGLQATEIIPDLILCDIEMPKVSGLELSAQLKQDELTQTVPLILLTGHSGEGSELGGLQAGVDDYITKPFEIAQLKARIKNLLKSRRLLRERYSKEMAEAPKAEPEPKLEDTFLQLAREIVESQLADFEFDANVLAEKMAVSSSSLWRRLKLSAEITPAAFIRELRLKQAYLLLQQEILLIDEVAERVGFLDTNYFRTCFKRQFGITPGQCREGEESVGNAPTDKDEPENPDQPQELTVLVVEDDADLRRYLCNELHAREYEVLEAENGKEGLEQAAASLPDIIITDLMMPILNGMELCVAIKQNDTTNHIPIAMLTARTDETVEIEGLDVGADEYITKPFEMDVLAARLNNLLKIRKQLAARYGKQIAESLESDPSIEDPFVQRVMACIEENLQDASFSVEQLAEKTGVALRTLQRKIPAMTDFTPNALIKTMRLKKAYQLLKTTNRPIGQVAYACGFEKPNYFSIQFRQHYGYSPSQMRKNETS